LEMIRRAKGCFCEIVALQIKSKQGIKTFKHLPNNWRGLPCALS